MVSVAANKHLKENIMTKFFKRFAIRVVPAVGVVKNWCGMTGNYFVEGGELNSVGGAQGVFWTHGTTDLACQAHFATSFKTEAEAKKHLKMLVKEGVVRNDSYVTASIMDNISGYKALPQ